MPTAARVVVVPQEQGQPLDVVDCELPDPGPHEVVVRQFASGVCHSQLHNIHSPRRTPLIVGHESTGEVLATGNNVTGLAVGDTVMVTWVPKDVDQARRRGGAYKLTLPDGRVAVTANVFTWATHTVADEMFVVKVPSGINRESTAIIGCAVITGAGAVLHTANVQPGDSVAIFGVGGVGLSAVAAARKCGANPIIAVDLAADKLELATRFGATHTVNASEVDPVAAIRDLTRAEGRFDILRQPLSGVDFAFDCIGLPVTMGQIAEVTRPGEFGHTRGGVAVLVGVPQTPLELDARFLFIGERSYRASLGGSCSPAEDFPRFLDWYDRGDLDLDALVTTRYPIDDIGRAVEDLERGRIAGRSVLVFD
ncbi:MAG: zinc-binding dehydrogenase [Acidimicrobiales bacterium]